MYNIAIELQCCTYLDLFAIMIQRKIEHEALSLPDKFPIVTITGPRQSGKTTFIKNTFPDFQYFSLENPDIRRLILDDPNGFISAIQNGVVLDEVQKVPELFSYIQTYSDNNPSIKFIISGSQNFQLLENINQSLAGCTAILKLTPFSYQELKRVGLIFENYEKQNFYGGYPRIYDKKIHPKDFYLNYIQTYVERDVRSIKNIQDLETFMKFVRLCAGRIGQLLNLNSLATDAGITLQQNHGYLCSKRVISFID